MSGEGEITSSDKFNIDNYYSLLELLDKLGKEGVAELVSKGNPQRITRGDMIYFVKNDVNRILGDELLEDSDSMEIIVDDGVDAEVTDFSAELVFHQTLIRRYKVGKEVELYTDKVLDLTNFNELYGRSKGDEKDKAYFKECGIISSLHGRLFLDDDLNVLYENIGANKSKIRGWKDQDYTVLEKGEIGVLFEYDALKAIGGGKHILMASIKIGYQMKPHFIIRINVSRKKI